MAAADHLSDLQFKFTSLGGLHRVDAINAAGQRVGAIGWRGDNGRVEGVNVNQYRRRQGIGTRLWYEAHTNAQREGLVHPVHSDVQMPDGKAWAAGLIQNAAKQRGSHPRSTRTAPSPDQATLF